MQRKLAILTAFALVLGAGLVHGRWIGRWHQSADIQAAAAKLDGVPTKIADWTGHDLEVNQEAMTLAGAVGHLSRRYESDRYKSTVSVVLLCGRPGPLSVHTPEVCFAGAGFQAESIPERYLAEPEDREHSPEFRLSSFQKVAGPQTTRIRAFLAWSAGKGWSAPDSPRLRFARYPFLYKLYVVAPVNDDPARDPAAEFIRELLPELDRALGIGH